jgi:DNA-binding GntR family transcriptional regulator
MKAFQEIQQSPKFVGKNLPEQVHEYVKNMILKSELKPGEKIPEEKIAAQLGVSRTPIREAMRVLSVQGLVKIYPNRFAEVVTLTHKETQDLGLLRITLDSLAAQYAIQFGSNADFQKLQRIADECKAAALEGDIYHRIKKDCDFHIEMTRIGRNELLLKMQKELYLKVHLLQASKYQDVEDSLRKIEHHDVIVKHLVNRDIDSVLKDIYLHLSSFYDINIKECRLYRLDQWA